MFYDISLGNDSIVVTDKLSAAIQELDILFNTTNTELIGEPYFGTDWHQFLWEVIPSCNELKKYIEDKIQQNCYYVNQMEHNIDVQTMDYDDRAESVYVVSIVLVYKNGFIPVRKKRVFVLA